MNRTEYQTARALIRANGRIAYGWLHHDHSALMLTLNNQKPDALQERARSARVEKKYGEWKPGLCVRLVPLFNR